LTQAGAWLALAGLTVTLMAGCEKKEAAPPPPAEVSVIKVEPRDTPIVYEYIATTQSPQEVNIVARVSGFLDKQLYTEGDIVKEGQVLFVMDQKPFIAQLQAMQASYDQAKAAHDTAGSILIVGLLAGWARGRYPVFGAIPVPAQRLLMDIGLIVFIAVVGLHAGPHAVEAYHQSGGAFFASIFAAGMVVTVVPLAVGAVVARIVLGMNPMMVLGGLAGAQTCTPGLNALREASGSNIGALAYTVPYAIGNILLTILGASGRRDPVRASQLKGGPAEGRGKNFA
jgi:AspT/YidE/YbjL antiporter-like protein